MGAAARDLLAALLEGVFANGDVQTTTLAFSIAGPAGGRVRQRGCSDDNTGIQHRVFADVLGKQRWEPLPVTFSRPYWRVCSPAGMCRRQRWRSASPALLEGVFASGDVQTTTLAFSIACEQQWEPLPVTFSRPYWRVCSPAGMSRRRRWRSASPALLEGVFASGDVQTTTLVFSIACSLGFSVKSNGSRCP
ncbi:hypothetical protein Bbelb_166850 [Branchiostoma belcheri]|nr:hypothetical protein Bbelb_166850 [Branchiostoma belcheri]